MADGGTTVHLDQPKIQFFRHLAYSPFVDGNGVPLSGVSSAALAQARQSKAPVELSGTINLRKDGEIELVQIQFGDLMGTQLPQGALTFHTHTVPPGTTSERNMSTDVPSPVDLTSIAMSIVFHGAREHLVFTPHYVYTITLYKEFFDQLLHSAAQMSSSQLERQTSATLDATYQQLIQTHGQNFGAAFVQDWMDHVQNQGYNIHRFEDHQDVSFVFGPFTRRIDDLKWDNSPQWKTAQHAPQTEASEKLWRERATILAFVGGAAFMATLALRSE